MKNNIKKVISEAGIWIYLLVITNLFFIFMLWLASPSTFKTLANVMIIFTLMVIVVGIVFRLNKLKKEERLFEKFLHNPSEVNEVNLLNIVAESSVDRIKTIGDRLRTLENSIKESENKYLEYEELIEGWVHEIKTPIHLGTLILENRQDEMSEIVNKRFHYVMHKVRVNLDSLLYYARLQSSHLNIKLKKANIKEITEEVVFDLNNLIKEKEINVEISIENKEVVTDENTLKFILSQVIENAIKYSKDEKTIWINLGEEKEDGKTYLEVKDNGIGIEEEDLPFIFDKGFTGNYENKNKSTGIGLYLVKRYCDLIKVDIEFNSIKEKGFSIKFIFPKVD